MKHLLSRFAFAAAVAAVSFSSQAAVVFDSSLGSYDYTYTETRSSGFNYAAVLHFNQDVSVSKIGVFTKVDNNQDIKFLIFDSQSNGGTGSLLLSDQKSFAATTSQAFIYSDDINFTFLGGHTYDVGILGSTGSLTGLWGVGDYTQGAITEISNNANFNNFASPTTGGYAGVSPYVQLVAAVPEPATTALLGLGLLGFAISRRKSAPGKNA